MLSPSLFKTLLHELTTRARSARINEPDLVINDPDELTAYTHAGREDGVMAPVYLFHCAQICGVIRPVDTVVDLGCGPDTQQAMVACLNPACQFIGVDLSPDMLDRAREHAAEQALDNIEFRTEDITRLKSFPDQSVDALVSTVALHHLPDVEALEIPFQRFIGYSNRAGEFTWQTSAT